MLRLCGVGAFILAALPPLALLSSYQYRRQVVVCFILILKNGGLICSEMKGMPAVNSKPGH
jgi:hypothetical protein